MYGSALTIRDECANHGQTFKKRALEIADKAQNTRGAQQGDGSVDFLSTLDETERSREWF